MRVFKTLKAQLLVYMVILMAAMLLTTVIVSSYLNARALDEQANNYTSQMLAQIQSNIERIVSTGKNIVRYLSEDESVLGFLRLEGFYSPGRIELETKARDAMRVYVHNNPDLIGGMLIVSQSGLYASGELYRTSRNPLAEEGWYCEAAAAGGRCLLISKPIGRNLQNYRGYGSMDIVSFVQAVYDPVGGALLGVICMDLQLKVIEDYIRNITLGKDGYVFVIDADEEIVYAPINDTVYRIKSSWLQEDEPPVHSIGGRRYQLMSVHSELTDWRIVGVFNTDTMVEPVQRIYSYTLMIGAGALAVTALVSIWFSFSFTRPISRIKRLMQQAEKGDLTVSFEAGNSCEEIGELAGSFNAMIARLHSLMDRVVIEQNLKREAEIKTLQAQIKPHFLYNALDTIRWMAEEHQAGDISMMVTALTKLFRVSLSRGHEIINLSEELEHVRSYLYIQKVRYEEKLIYSVDCPEELLPCKVNKLILQPLVENAIYHGIKQKEGQGRIDVSAREEDGFLVLTIRDNGAGMSREQCDVLNAALRQNSPDSYKHGYGIFNVNDRLRLTHGSMYGLFYSLNEEGGVTVRAMLPLRQEAAISGMERSIKETR